LLTESLLLSALGGVLGFLVAQWGVRVLQFMLNGTSGERFTFIVSADWRVFGFSLFVTVLTGLLFGVAPAVRLTRVNLSPALKESPSTFQGRSFSGVRLSGVLVVAQVALCVLVLVSAGLLVRTLRDLRSIDPGFDTNNVLLFAVDPSLLNYDEGHIQNLYRQLRDRFAAVPGVTSASYASAALLSGSLMRTEFHIPGQNDKTNADTDILRIGPDFLQTLRIPLLDGRTFAPADYAIAEKVEAAETTRLKAKLEQTKATAKTAPPSALPNLGPPVPILVNQEFVERYLPKQTYLGRRVEEPREENSSSPPDDPGFEIVGLVGNTKYQDLRTDIAPTVYVPLARGGSHFELRTAIEPSALIPTIRNIVNEVDSNLPVYDVRTQSMRIEQLISREKTIAHLSTFFGLLALLLACIGLYGLLAYEVARRTREIGVRVALGAQQRDVVSMVVKEGMVLVFLGALFGVAAGLGLTRYLRSLLFGVDPLDPITFAAVVALLVIVAFTACYVPARRAATIDPMVALRYE
jgi:predicted permease